MGLLRALHLHTVAVSISDVHPVVRAASAPTRTLGRRKLVRNRFTIDTDIVFDGDIDADADSPDSQHALQPADTDRWVEEQFDLQRYEEQEQVKETDILSDEDGGDDGGDDEDDDLSQSALSPSLELEGQMSALSLDEEEQNTSESKDSKSQHALRLSHLAKQCAMSVASVDDQPAPDDDVIWVRRDLSSPETENTPES